MKSEVMFRDLPGGPLLVKFADGVSMWCLCSKCGMYSKDMFQDAASHAFCSVCIFQCGERQTILCKQENRDVPVEEDHYIECAGTNIACLSCGSIVKGPHWERHINTCPQGIVQCRYCDVAIPRSSLEAHEKLCYDNQDTRQRPIWTTSVSHARDSFSQPPPPKDIKVNMDNRTVDGATVIQAQPICDNVDSDESLLQCIVCKRNVKRKNLKLHNKICAQKKERSTVSSVGNIPGNIQVTPDSRKNTPMEGPYDPPREATTVRKPSLSCDTGCFAEDSSNTPIVAPSAPPRGVTTLKDSSPLCAPNSIAPDSRKTSIVGSNDPYQEVAASQSSFTSRGSPSAEDALQSIHIASGVTASSRHILKETLQVWSYVFGSDPMKTETAEGSGVVPGFTSSSSAANRLEGSSFLLSWPAHPCHRKISEWFDHFEAWLARNDITTEDKQFALLLNKLPRIVSDALIYLQDNPKPYSAAKFTILHNFQIKDGVI